MVNPDYGGTLEDAADELREALSDEGMQRYVTPAPVPSQPESRQEPTPEPEAEIIPYRWNAKKCPYCRCRGAAQKRRDGDSVQSGGVAYCQRRRGGLH